VVAVGFGDYDFWFIVFGFVWSYPGDVATKASIIALSDLPLGIGLRKLETSGTRNKVLFLAEDLRELLYSIVALCPRKCLVYFRNQLLILRPNRVIGTHLNLGHSDNLKQLTVVNPILFIASSVPIGVKTYTIDFMTHFSNGLSNQHDIWSI